jgi:FkbM family methyltransferase
VKLKTRVFQIIADLFPTECMEKSRLLSAVWRVLFYAIRPNQPFRFRTRDYEMIAVPRKDHLSRTVIRRGYWERLESDVIRSRLSYGMNVVDAGASFGHYTMLAAKRVGPSGKVFAFEPEPVIFRELKQNLQLRPYENVEAYNGALGDRDGEIELVFDRGNPGGHSLFANNVRIEGDRVRTSVWRLDTFLAQHTQVNQLDLLKIDTQGAEGLILEGAWSVIERDHPIIVMEFWPKGLEASGYDSKELLNRLAGLGYTISIIDEVNGALISVGNEIQSWPLVFDADESNTNLLLEIR